MSNDYFQFKKFRINQLNSAMKVGTDGCLLGAWIPIDQVHKVLDIGTGTGLLALMCAQRLATLGQSFQVDAVEIEAKAVLQASENVSSSPWKDRICIICQDILEYSSTVKYDLIICNPPYFVNSLECPKKERTQARHNSSLPFSDLVEKVSELLADAGNFCLILPADLLEDFLQIAGKHALFCTKCTFVKTVERKEPKRVLAQFSKIESQRREDVLILQQEGIYTEAAKKLLRDFYLNL